VAYYLFTLTGHHGDAQTLRAQGAERLRRGRWDVDSTERHRDALTVGDVALIYIGAPVRAFVGCVELASAVRAATGHVLLTRVEQWDPPVPVADVLGRIDTSGGARADFDEGVLRVTELEYATAVAVARAR
jgi:hypothetical protein